MRQAAVARSDGGRWLLSGMAVLLTAGLLAAAMPEHALRILVVLVAIPAVASLSVPPLQELGRRIAASWGGESVAFALETPVLRHMLAALLAIQVAGGAAMVAMRFSSQPWVSVPTWTAWAPLGVAAALASLPALAASVRWASLASSGAAPVLVAAAGIGLVAGASLDARFAGPLALGAMLGPAQALPALMATLWLPWISGAAVVTGVVGGLAVALAASFFTDAGTAALAGLCVNLFMSSLAGLAGPERDLDRRTRLQRVLPATWLSRRRSLAGAVITLWMFLFLGPGWDLVGEASGGEQPTALIAFASGIAGWLWLAGQKRTSQSMRP